MKFEEQGGGAMNVGANLFIHQSEGWVELLFI